MTQNLEQLMQLLQKEPGAFCVSWIQRRLRLSYANACVLRDGRWGKRVCLCAARARTEC